ncbi:glycosyltransferase family 39 protein [Microbacterium sp. BWT-B31]|uniref:glycosyltransferase family 39 protein n=1 Tax=Microbacterium sp. BWT-B31 TaxID=3232072 RepID=UPI0035273E6F
MMPSLERAQDRARASARSSALARVAALVGLIATAISAAGSWIPSLWGDEAASVLSAQRPLGSLMNMLIHVDAVHGLYYLGLHSWVDVFGASPFAVRFPSAIAAGVTAAAVAWLCGRFGSTAFGLLGGLITAVLPRMTYAGEEARGYAFAAAIATALCVIVVEIMRREEASRRWWIAYAAVLALGLYIFLFLGLMVIVIGLVLRADRQGRRLLRTWAVWTGWAFVAALPVLTLAVIERNQIAFLAKTDRATASGILVRMWFETVPFAILAWALILVAIAGAVRRWRAARRLVEPETLALAWMVVPMGAVLAVNPFVGTFTPRYGTLAAPAAAILMACGVREIARCRLAGASILAAVVVLAVPVWAGQRTPWAKNDSDWNDLAAAIHAGARQGDAIVFDESVRPSLRPRLALDTNPAPFAAVSDVTLAIPYTDNDLWDSTAYSVPEAAALGRFDGVDRVWVVANARRGSSKPYGIADLEALGFRQASEEHLHSSVVSLFTR